MVAGASFTLRSCRTVLSLFRCLDYVGRFTAEEGCHTMAWKELLLSKPSSSSKCHQCQRLLSNITGVSSSAVWRTRPEAGLILGQFVCVLVCVFQRQSPIFLGHQSHCSKWIHQNLAYCFCGERFRVADFQPELARTRDNFRPVRASVNFSELLSKTHHVKSDYISFVKWK